MKPEPVTRRAFLGASTAVAASLTLASRPYASASTPAPAADHASVLYGRVTGRGFASGTPASPSRSRVTLLDGRVLEASHVTAQRIRAGKSVVLSPDADGDWSILYAEV